jgi:hypothetical protein
MTEVGVSLALRRHRSLIGSGSTDGKTNDKRKRLHSPSPGFSPLNSDNGKESNRGSGSRTKKKSKGKILGQALPSYSSWRILFEGAALYIFCMILPNILMTIGRLSQTIWRETAAVLYQIPRYICSQSWLLEWQTCQMYLSDNVQNVPTNSSVLAPDAGISDLAIIIFLSLSMAVTRVALVHFLVPNYKQPKRLEALVRCKSMHLLSSSYSGAVTPTKAMRMKSFDHRATNTLAGFHLPSLNSKKDWGNEDDEMYDYQPITANNISLPPKFPSRTSSDLDHKINALPSSMTTGLRIYKQKGNRLFPDETASPSEANWSSRENYNHEDNYDADESQFQAPAVSSGLLSRNSAQNLQALLEQAAPTASSRALQRRESLQKSTKTETTDRIFAAPKYATAVFRLIYCLVSCLTAFYYFRAADFWPPVVGGTGSTKNCWDLSSVGVNLMHTDFDIVDPDLDSYNPVLRRYYLIQASYHFHSAAFHILTSLLLWFVSKSSRRKESQTQRFRGFFQNSFFTLYNVRIFFQHIFSLVLILGTYLFSSTRRLGVIGMFSFDASSLFLHLLQLGINAPQKGTGSSRKSMILIMYRFFVIPSFCYARFYVWPFVVGYSAMEESQAWLQQLENMLMPGTAKSIHGFFVIAFLTFILMNLVYFWRLLNHPHVIDALQWPRRT